MVYATAGSVFCVTATARHSSGSCAWPVFCVGDSSGCGSFCILTVGGIFFPLGREAPLLAVSCTPSSFCCSFSCPRSLDWELLDPFPISFLDPSPIRRLSAVLGPVSQPVRSCCLSGGRQRARDMSTSCSQSCS